MCHLFNHLPSPPLSLFRIILRCLQPLVFFQMKISFLTLLPLLLLAFSYALSASAVPATRSQNLNPQDALPLSSLPQVNDAVELENVAEADGEAGLLIERRMDFETQDYGGTGANKDHDPKSPGRA